MRACILNLPDMAPVRIDALDGLQPGAAVNALLKRIPSLAMRSKFGVLLQYNHKHLHEDRLIIRNSK
jgi:hypothetical protein